MILNEYLECGSYNYKIQSETARLQVPKENGFSLGILLHALLSRFFKIIKIAQYMHKLSNKCTEHKIQNIPLG